MPIRTQDTSGAPPTKRMQRMRFQETNQHRTSQDVLTIQRAVNIEDDRFERRTPFGSTRQRDDTWKNTASESYVLTGTTSALSHFPPGMPRTRRWIRATGRYCSSRATTYSILKNHFGR